MTQQTELDQAREELGVAHRSIKECWDDPRHIDDDEFYARVATLDERSKAYRKAAEATIKRLAGEVSGQLDVINRHAENTLRCVQRIKQLESEIEQLKKGGE